jgi:hypothetical protein
MISSAYYAFFLCGGRFLGAGELLLRCIFFDDT